MTMQAVILTVSCDSLLVFDRRTRQRVHVSFPGACRFSAGDLVCIRYNGVMTRSIPPQITADSIRRLTLIGADRFCR